MSLLSGVASAIGTVVLMPLVIKMLTKQNLVDVPVARSSHTSITLRGGGLAMALPLVGAFLVFGNPTTPLAIASGIGLLALAAVGFVDDKRDLGVKLRLLAVLTVGLAFGIAVFGMSPFAFVGAFLVVAFVNAFNFMDGINGISAVTMLVAGIAYGIFGLSGGHDDLAALGLAIAGAGLGFLPFNFPTAKVFLGDVGSYLAGGAIALAAILAWDAGISIVVAFSPLALYGVDTFFTLTNRIRRGEKWHEPHREHVYQRVAAMTSHVVATLVMGAFSVLVIGLASVLVERDVVILLVLVPITVLVSAYLFVPSFVDRSRNE